MDELTKLKHWIDSEFTIQHIFNYVIIGLLVSSKLGWIICGVLIFVSIVYLLRRTTALAKVDKDYLKVKS